MSPKFLKRERSLSVVNNGRGATLFGGAARFLEISPLISGHPGLGFRIRVGGRGGLGMGFRGRRQGLEVGG